MPVSRSWLCHHPCVAKPSQVMAKRRVQRGEADARKYGSMHAARELVHGTGDTPSFVDVDPVQVLTYIADDLGFAQVRL